MEFTWICILCQDVSLQTCIFEKPFLKSYVWNTQSFSWNCIVRASAFRDFWEGAVYCLLVAEIGVATAETGLEQDPNARCVIASAPLCLLLRKSYLKIWSQTQQIHNSWPCLRFDVEFKRVNKIEIYRTSAFLHAAGMRANTEQELIFQKILRSSKRYIVSGGSQCTPIDIV